MAPAEVSEDYYAVLEVPPTATLDAITKNYKRLALLRHPDRNLLGVNTTAAFQLLQSAYETLKSPTERQIYDRAHPGIKARHESTHRRATAAQAEYQHATSLANSLRILQAELKRHEDELFESNRALRKLEGLIKRSQELDAEDDKREKARNSWWAYLAAPVIGKVTEETEQEKSCREMERLQRGASRRIRESEKAKREKEVEGFLCKINRVRARIEAEKSRAEAEAAAVDRARSARMQDEAREQQEQKRREMEEARFRAEVMRKRREQEERERQQEERERQQKAAQEYMRKFERESREREDRWAEEARQRAKEPGGPAQRKQGRQNGRTNEKNVCRHQKFWSKVDGRQLCSECKIVQPRFGFRCPGCSKVACASCRQKVRGEGQRPSRGKSKEYEQNAESEFFGY